MNLKLFVVVVHYLTDMTRPQQVKRICPNTGDVVFFDSLVDAEKGTSGARKPNICKCLSGQLKKHAGYMWERVSDNIEDTEWREYPGFPGTSVSNTGQVKVKGVLRKVIKESRCQNVFIYLDKLVLLWKIVAATYFPEQFNSKSRNCDFKDGNPENCSVDNLILNPPPKPRKNIEKVSEKVCTVCDNLLGIHFFSENRNVCNSCRRQQQKSRSVTKTCSECKQTGESNTFHGSKCNKCTWKQKVEKNQLKTDVGNLPKQCIKCHTVTSDFQFRKELNAYRNVCVTCVKLNNQEKQHWKAWRLKQRTINEDSFLRRNAEVHREWIRNNPEAAARINLSKPKSAVQRLTQLFYNAKEKGISYDKSESDLLMAKMSTPCSFCDYLDLDVRVNTLTLINKEIGYINSNTLSACTTCSTMKHTRKISQFLGSVFDIVVHKNLDTTDLPIARTLPKSGWTGNGHVNIHNYTKKLNLLDDKDEVRNRMDFPCYLCGISPSDGVDRIDSNKPYISDNINPCCSSCNYLKKDFILKELFIHLAYIFNKCYNQSDFQILSNASASYSKDWMKPKEDDFELSDFFTNAVVLGHDITNNDNTKTYYKRARRKYVENPNHYRLLVYSLDPSSGMYTNLVASYPSMKECAEAMCYNYTGITKRIKEHGGIVCKQMYKLVTEKSIEKWEELSKSVTEHSQKIFERDAHKCGKQKFEF